MGVFVGVWTVISRMMTGVRDLLHSSSTSLLLLSSLPAARADTLVNNTDSPRSPNVLFIVADDLGWNDVSWHNPMIHSPSLEQLAASGVLLDQYYVQPTCSPSRVAMMTGKYPYRWATPRQCDPFPELAGSTCTSSL